MSCSYIFHMYTHTYIYIYNAHEWWIWENDLINESNNQVDQCYNWLDLTPKLANFNCAMHTQIWLT